MRDPEHIALTFAVAMKRAGRTRARISDKTFRLLSERKQVKGGLVRNAYDWLVQYGYVLIELNRGGFGIAAVSALEGAPALKLGDALPEWRELSKEELLAELEGADDDDDGE